MYFVLPKSMCSLVEQLLMNFYGQALRFTSTPIKFLGKLYVSLKMRVHLVLEEELIGTMLLYSDIFGILYSMDP